MATGPAESAVPVISEDDRVDEAHRQDGAAARRAGGAAALGRRECDRMVPKVTLPGDGDTKSALGGGRRISSVLGCCRNPNFSGGVR